MFAVGEILFYNEQASRYYDMLIPVSITPSPLSRSGDERYASPASLRLQLVLFVCTIGYYCLIVSLAIYLKPLSAIISLTEPHPRAPVVGACFYYVEMSSLDAGLPCGEVGQEISHN